MSPFIANIILFAFSFCNLHAHYVSITNAKLNSQNNKLEISIQLTAHDLEDYFFINDKLQLKLGSTKEYKNSNQLISSYISDHLHFKINDKSTPLNFIGKEVNNDETLELFFESKIPRNINKITIENTILIETFSEQQNIIHLSGYLKESFTFNDKLTSKTYSLKN